MTETKKQRSVPIVVKTAEQWQRELRMLEVNPIEDARDDVISMIRNSGMTFVQIHAKGGPTAGTLYRWEDKKVKRPQHETLRMALHAIGKDWFIGDRFKK